MKALHNMTLRIATFEMENVLGIKRINGQTFFERHVGYLSDFMLLLQDCLGFSYQIIEDVVEGVKLENGTWNGRNGRVHRNEVDIGYPTGITYDRLEAVDYTNVYDILSVNFYTREADPLSKMFVLIYPFDVWVWIASVITYIIASLSFRYIMKFNGRIISLQDIFWALFGSFTSQGNRLYTMKGNNKTLSICWNISLFVLVASYSGAIMSFLIHAGHEGVPRTFWELVIAMRNNEYKTGILFHTGVGKYVRDATESTPLLYALKELRREGKVLNVEPMDDIYEFLSRKKHALIHYEKDGEIRMNALGAENFIISEDPLYVQYEILAIPKGFRYKKHFNRAIRHVVESGLFIHTLKYQINKNRYKKYIENEMNEDAKPLTLEDLIAAFLLLFFGYVLSIFAFILELLINLKRFCNLSRVFAKIKNFIL